MVPFRAAHAAPNFFCFDTFLGGTEEIGVRACLTPITLTPITCDPRSPGGFETISGAGSNGTGGVVYADGVSSEGFRNRGWRDCSRAGCPTHESCILAPASALTPNIQGRSRMR